MYRFFCPRLTVETLYDINLQQLKEQGIKGIIFDLDNTIIPWDSSELCQVITAWLRAILDNGFQVAIVSNNWRSRVRAIAEVFGVPFVSRAYKPAKMGLRRAARILELAPAEVAMVGDQLFTDILGGNRLGFYTIWVKPLNTQEFLGTRVTRMVERWLVRRLQAKGLLP